MSRIIHLAAVLSILLPLSNQSALANGNVHVSRFWHNHQPLYWPEWNSNGSETQRKQYAWDSIVLKGSGQTYGTGQAHPDNNLVEIFGKADRVAAYQSGPRNSLASINSAGGFTVSYSGSLIDNIRNLGANNQLGYGGGWWDGNREARNWFTPSGSRRLDLVGFTYHHSLAPLLPKSVFRKELQIFKQAYWKAWGGNADLSDHSKGFFPTEMAFSQSIIDVLVDEGYEWAIVASHHLSRTCPTYNDHADPEGNYNIKSSPPNKADQLGPSPTDGWWFNEPNPGQATWNVSPFAYQLHRTKYVNPETGQEKSILVVPSDDALSYQAGYSGAQVGPIAANISPHATDPNRPVIVMPSTDGDNAWGGGSSSWHESTPSFFSDSQNAGYQITAVQDFVNQHGAAAANSYIHVEDGAWIFPVDDYGSPYFLKWLEPPLGKVGDPGLYPGTIADMESPGFALKFWSWAPVISGANWCETAEQIMLGEGGTVDAWKIQAPHDWNGTPSNPNVVEQAWHMYLGGLDSGFNYYGGLGNDDEVKQSLATQRAIETLGTYVNARLNNDLTGPTMLKPQRFPHNPGAYTFGWFNRQPGLDERYLKKMPSEFYIWSHVYDVSDVQSVNLRVRIDSDGENTLANNQNETFSGGGDVGAWITVPMTKRVLPNGRTELNAKANHGDIDYFIEVDEIADYYFAKITDAGVAGFRGKLLDYYVEATDTRGNVRKSDIQHVFVEDDGLGGGGGPTVNFNPASPDNCPGSQLSVTYNPGNGPLQAAGPVHLEISFDGGASSDIVMSGSAGSAWNSSVNIPNGANIASVYFHNGGGVTDDNNGSNWSTGIANCPEPPSVSFNPPAPDGCVPVTVTYSPGTGPLENANPVMIHIGHDGWEDTIVPNPSMSTTDGGETWTYVYASNPGTETINVVFNDGAGIWDNNGGSDWGLPVLNCVGVFNPDICATKASPAISTASTETQNKIGDNFDFRTLGGAASTSAQGGFGSFGQIYVNYDATNLYIGARDADFVGANNGMIVFIGLSSLSDDKQNLWSNTGLPLGLDMLHNVEFVIPMDIGILLGSEEGDFTDATTTLEGGYQFGQGAFYLSSDDFDLVAGSRLSQFDGTTTNATVSTDDDGDAVTDRWELCLPWSALNAAGIESLSSMHIAGLIMSDSVSGPDRYLSANYLGKSAVSTIDEFNNFGFNFVQLRGIEVCLPHSDGDTDGLSNEFELEYYNNAAIAEPDTDGDGDGFTNLDESQLGTNPNNASSSFIIHRVDHSGAYPVLTWSSSGGKEYYVESCDDLTGSSFSVITTVSETDVPSGTESTESFVDDYTLSGEPANGFRAYRVRLKTD